MDGTLGCSGEDAVRGGVRQGGCGERGVPLVSLVTAGKGGCEVAVQV